MKQCSDPPRLGFIGFGEAASHIAAGLYDEGMRGIVAFTAHGADPELGKPVRERARAAHATLLPSLAELVAAAEIVLCATSAKVALEIARQAQPWLREGQLYADLNSTSPQVKREIGAVVGAAGALFADGAIMALVPPYRHKVPLAVSGTGARPFAARLAGWGMEITYVNDRAGSASAIKMLRSIFVKGLASLLLETLTASRKAGVDEEIMASIRETIEEQPFEKLANLLLTRTAVSAHRRVAEMGEVIDTLAEMGIDSSISRATQAKLQGLAALDLPALFGPKPPAHYEEVLDAIIDRSGGNGS